ncbi:uracil-DNA glycosylase family protein [Marinobacterium weihaiense]|uniref:Uracil DNA glycosylase superfamily protein n=1 Tax=Marinobacterium weihaiense TaxID=2851016 RepID=A0ABS6M859_9GAMM|nr:hypothetical protein [Marinobacterium weihaiense]MBV0932476.1 hypothetical protein [Marinobacterium weihaiense]
MSLQAQEQQRHQWLEAIGIDSWLPRQPLPGAATSPDWVAGFHAAEHVDAPAAVSTPASPVAKSSSGPQARSASPRSAGSGIDTATLVDVPAPKPAATAAPVAAGPRTVGPRTVGPRTALEPAPRFKLAYLVCADLLIIDSLPPHHADGFSRQHKRLLQGMTRALGLPAEQALSAPFMLPWPMLASKTLDQGPEEARRAARHKLQRTLEFKPEIRHVLLLGEAALQWVVDTERVLDECQGQWLPLAEGRQALVTLSLSELLRLPERKAEVWRDLQPLRRLPGAADAC